MMVMLILIADDPDCIPPMLMMRSARVPRGKAASVGRAARDKIVAPDRVGPLVGSKPGVHEARVVRVVTVTAKEDVPVLRLVLRRASAQRARATPEGVLRALARQVGEASERAARVVPDHLDRREAEQRRAARRGLAAREHAAEVGVHDELGRREGEVPVVGEAALLAHYLYGEVRLVG